MASEQDEHAVPTEGRSRGPQIHPGGKSEIDAPLPPYEGHQETGKDNEQLIRERGGTDHDAGQRAVSQEEREGVSATDTSAASPMGVGKSAGSEGNEQMLGSSEEARRDERLGFNVGASENIDPESPPQHSGSQGG